MIRKLVIRACSLIVCTTTAAGGQDLRESFDGGDPGSPAPVAEVAGKSGQGFAILGGLLLELTNDKYTDQAGLGSGTSLEPEGYVEFEVNGLYAGVWATTADQDYGADEVDLYLGYRRERESGFTYDLGYTRYYYPDEGWNCCGEVTLSLFGPLSEAFGIGTDLAYDPENAVGNAYMYVEYYATGNLTASANYGMYETVDLPNETGWDIGATYSFTDDTTLDLRWFDGSDYPGYVALALSFDATLFQR